MSKYLQKENAIIQKLHDTNYELFDGQKDEALDFLDDQLSKFSQYANIVISQQHLLPIYRVRYEGQDYRDHVESLDHNRRTIHNCAIDSVNILNRLSDKLGLEPFSDVDTKDRNAVANMIGDYIVEMYQTGTNGGMDGATYNKETPYNEKVLKDRRRQLAKLCEDIPCNMEHEIQQSM